MNKNGSAGDQLGGNDDVAARLKFRFSNGVSITIQVTFDQNFTLCNSECTRTVLVINSGLIHQFCPADLPHGQGRTCGEIMVEDETWG